MRLQKARPWPVPSKFHATRYSTLQNCMMHVICGSLALRRGYLKWYSVTLSPCVLFIIASLDRTRESRDSYILLLLSSGAFLNIYFSPVHDLIWCPQMPQVVRSVLRLSRAALTADSSLRSVQIGYARCCSSHSQPPRNYGNCKTCGKPLKNVTATREYCVLFPLWSHVLLCVLCSGVSVCVLWDVQ